MKTYKSEKGAISLFVTLACLFFTFILSGIYISNLQVLQTQEQQINQIQENYSRDLESIDEILGVTAIIAKDFEISATGEKRIEEIITTIPEENLEELEYEVSSSPEGKVRYEDGKIKALTSGEATLTITVKGKALEPATCKVTITPARVSLTAEQIAKNKEVYYGCEVKNYNINDINHKYRIFYVDTEGKFGTANTIYLKADKEEGKTLKIPATLLANTKMKETNPDWWNNRVGADKTTIPTELWDGDTTNGELKENEKVAAWLCDPTTNETTSNQEWANWFDKNMADWVIGGPGVEMYVASYNSIAHPEIEDKYPANAKLGAKYSQTRTYGYIYTINDAQSIISADDYETGQNSISRTVAKGMFVGGESGYWWFSSPSSYNWQIVCNLNCTDPSLYCNFHGKSLGISPLIALKNGVEVQVDI